MYERKPRLEVFPQDHSDAVFPEPGSHLIGVKHYVRLRAANGIKWLVSDPYDTKSNALAAAKTINKTVAAGRLEILVLDEDGKVVRIIEPKRLPR
jgi:hypothetical protein